MPTMRLEHQESINRFSRLNTEKKMLEARKKALERTLEDAEEAGNEVMLADEETGTLMRVWVWDNGHYRSSCPLLRGPRVAAEYGRGMCVEHALGMRLLDACYFL